MSTAPVVQIAGTGVAGASWTTASFTPPANTRLVAYVSSYKATAGVAPPTISDTSALTWTQLDDYVISTFANPDMRGTWFMSSDVGGSPASMTVTVASASAASMAVTIASVLTSEVSGSTVQVAHGEDLTNGDPTLTFGSAPGANNITLLGASFTGANSATVPTGYTALSNASHSAARRNAASYDITSAATSPQYVSTNSRSIILGIELAPSSGDQTITAALFTDADTFYGATVAPGAVDITGALFANSNSFFGSTVSATYAVTGGLYSDADTFFAAAVSRGTVGITGALYTDPDTFFAATVSQAGDQTITGALYANDNTFYGATVANVVPMSLVIGAGIPRKRKSEEDEEYLTEVRRVAKAKVVTAIQQGLLVELTRAGVREYAKQTVERIGPEMPDAQINEITARITASMHRVIAQKRQEEDDAEAFLLVA